MSGRPLVKVAAATAAEVCAHFDLGPDARPLLRKGIGPREFVEALLANKRYLAGIDFLAHALPAREGIWWGCLSLQHASGGELSGLDRAACQAAVRWILDPTEENRVAAREPGEAAGLGSVAGRLALAASEAGAGPAPAGAPGPARTPFGPAKGVAGAVKLASTKGDPARIVDTHRRLLELGVGVADGRFPRPELRDGVAVWRRG